MANVHELFDLTGRVAVITGGAGLLGAEFCRTLVAAGAAITIADLDGQAAVDLAAALNQTGHGALGYMTDVTSVYSVSAMVRATLDAYGRLDILVNSAAMDPKFDPASQQSHSGSFENYPLDLWHKAIEVNLTGAMLCCQAAVKPMLEQGGGVIINISSIYGISAPDQRLYKRKNQSQQFKPVYYSVTKAGILGLTKYLAAYYGEKNIRVNALSPGGVYNGHNDEFLQAYAAHAVLGRMAEKDEMNGALLFLASEASNYMTGANLIVDGGWTTW